MIIKYPTLPKACSKYEGLAASDSETSGCERQRLKDIRSPEPPTSYRVAVKGLNLSYNNGHNGDR